MSEKRDFILNCIDDFNDSIEDYYSSAVRCRYPAERYVYDIKIAELKKWRDLFKDLLKECAD